MNITSYKNSPQSKPISQDIHSSELEQTTQRVESTSSNIFSKKEELYAYNRLYKQTHKEQISDKKKIYYQLHKDRLKAAVKERQKKQKNLSTSSAKPRSDRGLHILADCCLSIGLLETSPLGKELRRNFSNTASINRT